MRALRNLSLSAVALAAAAACSGTDYKPRKMTDVSIPVRDTTPKAARSEGRESPPASGPARELKIPLPSWTDVGGLKVATIESHALPIVQLRVVVLAGKAHDADKPGLAQITGELLKDGGAGGMNSRDLLNRVESLGGSLHVDVGFDKTVVSIAVTKEHLSEAMSLLGAIVAKPRFDGPELGKLKKREIDRVADSARTNGRWAANMVLWRDLFALPTERHPYATYDAMPSEVEKVAGPDVRAFHQRWYVPKNAFVVVAGDTTAADVKKAVERAFAGWRGGDPPAVAFTDPMPQESLKITLVHRPKAKQSDVFVGVLGPDRRSKDWPEMAVANQVLGGGVSGRLFLDVREKLSLAYNTRSSLAEIARGPAPLIAYVGTQTPKTGLAVKALLGHLERLGTTAPDGEEIDTATRFLSDVMAIRIETIGAVADEIVNLRTLGLPDDYLSAYRKELREVTAATASKVAAEHVRTGHGVVVVAGDADRVGTMLSHFGEVKVVDPAKGFERIRSIPHAPSAPLEAPREAGE